MNQLIQKNMSLEDAIAVVTEGCIDLTADIRANLVKLYVDQGTTPIDALQKVLEYIASLHNTLPENITNSKPGVSVLNTWFADALRSRKEYKNLQGDELVLFGIRQSMDRYLNNLIWTAVVVCGYELLAKFAEGGERTLTKNNYWIVIANFRLTDSINVIE